MSPADCSISLIIPTWRPKAYDVEFRAALNALRQTFSRLQVVVIDSSSEKNQIDAHQSMADVFLQIPQAHFDHGDTRNQAARKATGDYLVFMTQDALLTSPQSLAELILPMLYDPQIAVTFGRQLPRSGAGPLEAFARTFNYPESPERKVFDPSQPMTLKHFFNSNVFAAYRADRFWEVGGFPKNVILNEDMMMAHKLLRRGYACYYAPKATVVHSHDYSIKQQFQRYFDIGASLRQRWDDFKDVRRTGDGKRFVLGLKNHLIRGRHFGSVIPAVMDIGARWLGFQLGLYYHRLPRRVRPRLSMHSFYWNKPTAKEI